MGLTVEEIRIKLGLDDKELDEGTRRALLKLGKMGKETEKAFYQHGEKPARAFHKVLHQLTEQFPLLGGAARIALSPIGGAMAFAVTAAIAFNEQLKKIHEMLDRVGKIMAKPTGNVFVAMRTAAKGNAADRRRAESELEGFSDPLKDMVANARTPEERRAALKAVEAARGKTASGVVAYDSNFSNRDKSRARVARSDESIKALEAQLEETKSLAESTRGSALTVEHAKEGGAWEKMAAFLEFGMSAGESMVGQTVNAAAEAAIPKLRKAIEKEAEKRDAIAESLADEEEKHKNGVDTLHKLDDARQTLIDQIRTQSQLQAVYNQQMAVTIRNKDEMRAAPFTPGLQELAGYRGPYGAIARESLAARDYAKRSFGFASADEMVGLRAGVNSAGTDLRGDLLSAKNPLDRNKAFRRYGERMDDLLTGHKSPERSLEAIEEHIKSLNEKATADGLIVRGSDK